MLHPLTLLLPALIPSWNFFDEIAASPRIEYALTDSLTDAPREWRAFRPRPQHVPFAAMVARLFWNARENETLFIVSCAERLLAEPTEHSQAEIFRRIAADLDGEIGALRFRIWLVGEEGGRSTREIAFVSAPRPLKKIPVQ